MGKTNFNNHITRKELFSNCPPRTMLNQFQVHSVRTLFSKRPPHSTLNQFRAHSVRTLFSKRPPHSALNQFQVHSVWLTHLSQQGPLALFLLFLAPSHLVLVFVLEGVHVDLQPQLGILSGLQLVLQLLDLQSLLCHSGLQGSPGLVQLMNLSRDKGHVPSHFPLYSWCCAGELLRWTWAVFINSTVTVQLTAQSWITWTPSDSKKLYHLNYSWQHNVNRNLIAQHWLTLTTPDRKKTEWPWLNLTALSCITPTAPDSIKLYHPSYTWNHKILITLTPPKAKALPLNHASYKFAYSKDCHSAFLTTGLLSVVVAQYFTLLFKWNMKWLLKLCV